MTQLDRVKRPLLQSLRRSLLLYGLVGVSGIKLFSGGVGLAQTPPAADAENVPSAQDLLSTPAASPVAPAIPAVTPTAPEPSAPQAAASVVQHRLPSAVAAPEAAAEPVIPSASTSLSVPPVQLPARTLPAPNLADDAQAAPSPTASVDETYIDTTDYSIGATQRNDRPNVVLSERSTGCQIVLRQGQSAPASICAARSPQIAVRRDAGSGNSVNVGPVRVSAGGFSVVGGTTPSGRDYYNLTTRPPGMLGNGNLTMMFPLSIPAAITSVFGWRIHPITGDRRFHSGTDLGAPIGTPVLAAYAGQVAIADFMQGYGLTVVLQHDLQHEQAAAAARSIPANKAAEETLYAHMSELFVRPGDWVRQGEVIGRVGTTGNSTGPHLHFEIRELTPQGWLALDPGVMLEYSMAQLVRSLQTAQANPQPFPEQSGFSRAIVKDITQELAAR